MPTPLPEELSIFCTAEVQALLRQLLADHAADPQACDTLTLDAANVAEVDAAGVQLLLSLSNSLLRDGRQLQIVEASQTLRQACQRLGAGWLLAPATQASDTACEATP